MIQANKYWSIISIIGVAVALNTIMHMDMFDGPWSAVCTIGFAVSIPIFAFVFKDKSVPSLLFTTFATTIVVRNADQHDWSIIGWSAAILYIPLFLQLIELTKESYKKIGSQATALTLIRMFVGLNWLTHCTEKLFISQHDAGLLGFFSHVVGGNTIGMDIPLPIAHYVIVLGGLAELTAAICLGLGFMTRLGAFVASGYLVAAQLMSGHFGVGYTWALPGGGWELCFFFFMVMYPFMFPKSAGPISLDFQYQTDKSNNKWIRSLSGA